MDNLWTGGGSLPDNLWISSLPDRRAGWLVGWRGVDNLWISVPVPLGGQAGLEALVVDNPTHTVVDKCDRDRAAGGVSRLAVRAGVMGGMAVSLT